ncbi:RNA-directed DNA polymerase-like protein [Gossypium australe]|uniref:RNA-directed DNA polymerase-like protein n=1 Tax=Gossypium australe TaxID=47621 RepID=A0A5B6VLM0_9ROSI|nr:RNA-directed DNA polymerase-like protein [Gossypium australe]
MFATPMTRLLQKDVKFKWSEKCQQSFDHLKALLTEAPVLVQPESGHTPEWLGRVSHTAVPWTMSQPVCKAGLNHTTCHTPVCLARVKC